MCRLLLIFLVALAPHLARGDQRVVHVEHPTGARQYEIGRQLASGASGTVHLGRDVVSGAEVATKLTKRAGGGHSFELEHTIMSALEGKSSHFARSYGVGHTNDDEPLRALVMERFHGSSIGQQEGTRIHMKPFRPGKAVRIMLQALDGIADLHALGYAHDDFHGAQIMADDQRSSASTRVLDVGNAKPLTDALRRNDLRQAVEVLARMVTGTDSAHWPPEEPLDHTHATMAGRKTTLGDVLRHARTVGYDTVDELRADLRAFAQNKVGSSQVRDGALLVDPHQAGHVFIIENGEKHHVVGPQLVSPAALSRLQHVAAGTLDDVPLGAPKTTFIP